MNIFTLYALICYFSVALTDCNFPIQRIDYDKYQIVAASIPEFEFKCPEICYVYYFEVNYKDNQFYYSKYYELFILNKRGKVIFKSFKQIPNTDTISIKRYNKIVEKIRRTQTPYIEFSKQ